MNDSDNVIYLIYNVLLWFIIYFRENMIKDSPFHTSATLVQKVR